MSNLLSSDDGKSSQRLLILSHHGGGFLNELVDAAKRLGLCIDIISSETDKKLATIAGVDQIKVLPIPTLQLDSVLEYIAQRKKYDSVAYSACISVWEGYRFLMAEINAHLGADDLLPKIARISQDKSAWRQILISKKLSRMASYTLGEDEDLPATLLEQNTNPKGWFVKPAVGVGSFGAETWSGEPIKALILKWRDALSGDFFYRDHLMTEGRDIMAVIETKLTGVECSFEAIVAPKSSVKVLAVHEKIPTKENKGTTIEPGCVSPPQSLTASEVHDGKNYVTEVMNVLGLDRGCYHIEAVFQDKSWEVLDINPRVGGSYIYESTKLISSYDLLELWICQLLGRDIKISSYPETATMFRVFFAEPGKKIKNIGFRSLPEQFKPLRTQINLKTGQSTPHTVREIFAGQSLWCVPKNQFNLFLSATESSFEIEYTEENS